MKSFLLKYRHLIFISFFILGLFATIVYKYNIRTINYNFHTPYTWIPSVFLYCVGLVYLFYFRKYKPLLIIALIAISKLLGSLLIASHYAGQLEFFKETILTISSYTFPIILIGFLDTISKNQLKQIINIFKWISLMVFILIILGALFPHPFFKTYNKIRFGFSGILYPQSYASYFLILSVSTLYVYRQRIHKIHALFIITGIIASLFLGTKSAYLFTACFLIYLFFKNRIYIKKQFLIGAPLLIIFIGIFYAQLKNFLTLKFETLINLYAKNDLVTFILSYRNYSFEKAVTFIKSEWNIFNFLFGGINRKAHLVEMGFVDLFLSFGILGTLLFIYLYTEYFFKKLAKSSDIVFILLLLFIIVFIGGNFFGKLAISYLITLFYLVSKKNIIN